MVYKVNIENSTYIFKLEEVLKKKKVSKYILEKDTGIDHKTIQNYCLGNLKRIDMRVVAVFCEYLQCNFNDIIYYTKNSTRLVNELVLFLFLHLLFSTF